jgi:hypothetical protein
MGDETAGASPAFQLTPGAGFAIFETECFRVKYEE